MKASDGVDVVVTAAKFTKVVGLTIVPLVLSIVLLIVVFKFSDRYTGTQAALDKKELLSYIDEKFDDHIETGHVESKTSFATVNGKIDHVVENQREMKADINEIKRYLYNGKK